jgi:hypothetical protein
MATVFVRSFAPAYPCAACRSELAHPRGRRRAAAHAPRNNDLWDCLPDGTGEGVEWTGGVFDASGTHFYVSVQHNVSGVGVVLDITGWK